MQTKNYFNDAYTSLTENRANQYYMNATFNRLTARGTKKNLCIIHVNIRSLKAIGDVLVSCLSTLNQSFHIICFTESWLGDLSIVLNDLFPQYLSFNSHRSGRRGGGTAVYI